MSSPDLKTLISTYMWRTIGAEGCERGELLAASDHHVLQGTILRLAETGPAEVRYKIVCDAAWRTKTADILCSDDLGERQLRIHREGGSWYANGKSLQLPDGCVDVDLEWSPSTNTLPIRRLHLDVGSSSGTLTMAWVRFPRLNIEPLPQTYERLKESMYRYSSGGGSFKANLTVDENGLVVDYEGGWRRVGIAKRRDENP